MTKEMRTRHSERRGESNSKKTHALICRKCGAQIDFNGEDIFTVKDWSEAYPQIYKRYIRCPYCMECNLFETRDIDGIVHKKMEIKPL